ncbi:hypothetical protein NBRC116493_16410 [Aurantivibrio infirmus]
MSKRKVGDIVKIDLKNGYFAFGRVLKEPLMAFYGFRATATPSVEEIVSKEILFKIWVMNNAVTSGRWPIVGHLDLDESLLKSVTFFKQDSISKKLYLYRDSKVLPASREECIGLEKAAVWSASHVEDRLRDYFDGIPNKWVGSLQIKE